MFKCHSLFKLILLASVLLLAEPLNAQTAAPVAKLSEQVEQTAQKTRNNLGEGDAVIVRSPFIIAGNMSERELLSWHSQTILPAANALKNQYFTRTPDAPITIWLLTNAKSYNALALRLFGDKDVSVYGYYKPDKRTLVMNIGTGGGTLVHELAHALAAFDFPGQPDWFNEGLASLYEQSSFQGTGEKQRIIGLVNWRLPQLQQALQKDELPTIVELVSNLDFRGRNVGRNYSQARYLCMYLQEQGKLSEFYRTFRDARQADKTGLASLQKVIGPENWPTFENDFRTWAKKLKQ